MIDHDERRHWIVGHGRPAYMPENPTYHVELWADAVTMLQGHMQQFADNVSAAGVGIHACGTDNSPTYGDIPCPTYDYHCPATVAADVRIARYVASRARWYRTVSVYASAFVWFVVPCDDPECTGPDY